ncbi:MFS transporter [Streptomyces beihaiensis]|uniref:MFS transporter n=1 Tax=Streptomyces beihaiensis TaxID=2984495 RepID=A0ABT3TXR0_9ACTN|nr:MFS transporter [Streptomyces beihaiensis]MCX3061837.1 MFS transporter [Streptomyces beihaiensis]
MATPSGGALSRLLDSTLVPRSSIGRKLAVTALVNALGTGMFYAGSALYFTKVVGLSDGQVGLGLSLAGLVGFLGTVPVGMLADRIRAGRVYVAIQVWRGLGNLAYCFVGNFTTFAVVACCIGLADASVPPVSQAVVGNAVGEEERGDTLAKVRAVRNVGFGLGALVATGAIQQGSHSAFLVLIAGNAVFFLVSAVMLQRAGVTRLATVAAPARNRRPTLVADLRYLATAGLNGLLSMHMTLLPLALPLWISQHTDVPLAVYGPLYVLNTVMAVLLQARFAKPSDTLRGAVASMTWAGFSLGAFALACWAMGASRAVWAGVVFAVLAVALLSAAELWQSAGAWAISYELARPDRLTQYLSTFQLGTALQGIVAPWVITALILPHSLGWPVFAAVAAVAGMAVTATVGRAEIRAREAASVTQAAAAGAEFEPEPEAAAAGKAS